MTITFRRYTDDPNTIEPELNLRSGQPVELVGTTFQPDADEDTLIMQRVRFADGFEVDAFDDELHATDSVS